MGKGESGQNSATSESLSIIVRAPATCGSVQITLQDEHAISQLNNFYERNDAQFIYELTRAFSSPLTAFSRIIERGRVIGYTVSKHIYPYHPEFTLRTLDIAIQSVVSTGAIGVAFLKWMTKVLDIQHERGVGLKDEDPTKLFE